MKNLIFNDDQFAFQLIRLLGESTFGASDIGEVISTAERIKEGDYKSWCNEWSNTAQRLHKIADDCYLKGHMISAKKAYLRASNYYRTAEFYMHENPNDSKISELYELSLECFSYVMKLNTPFIERVEIQYEGTTLPGHYYRLENSNEPKPVLIAMTGFDGTKEEFYGLAMTALEHGMNCLTIEGPGQGEVARKQNLFFRHDYEKVVIPVVDYLISRSETDPDKIVLWGESLGGYLAPRAAAFEHRIAACIANGGVYDFLGGYVHGTDTTREELVNFAHSNPDKLNKSLYDEMKTNSKSRWAISHGMYVFGADNPAELVLKGDKFYLKGIAEKIKCPTLVLDAENDGLLGGQAKPLYENLLCKKDYMMFTSEEGAEFHCQVGAKLIGNERIFSWIETILKNI
ncbi:alpha/beta hydrolase family protein [Clostridium estertheticum]|uniref:alpha/beta hydrolase family protein n=1 Tax=Clostridium estertheticum TaxID=238834 RepID=UPI001C0D024A|nr:alpha/beta fold hydrolase [Clostridium estertheticum]MBU3187767.1 esterase FrsA [Clostridium estertheticum]